jgi:hypothetical protein
MALLAVFAAVLAFPAPAAAQDPLPVGEAKGVRIVRQQGAIVVVFTRAADRLWRRVAGRMVSVFCDELADPDDLGLQSLDRGGSTFRAPRRGRRLRTGDLTRGMDTCTVSLPSRTRGPAGNRVRVPRRELVTIAMTQRGAVHLDERTKARRLFILMFAAELVIERDGLTGWPTYAQLSAAFGPDFDRIYPLSGPDDTPPPGRAGYWSDGDVTSLSSSSRSSVAGCSSSSAPTAPSTRTSASTCSNSVASPTSSVEAGCAETPLSSERPTMRALAATPGRSRRDGLAHGRADRRGQPLRVEGLEAHRLRRGEQRLAGEWRRRVEHEAAHVLVEEPAPERGHSRPGRSG